MHGLKKLIKFLTSVTCDTLTLIDHILASFPSKVSRNSFIVIWWVSNHPLIFFIRKISRLKTGVIHKYLKFRSFKNYAVDSYKEALKQLSVQNYKTFDHGTYSNFLKKIMTAIDKISPHKNKRVKENTLKWFGTKVLEKLNARDKIFKYLKTPYLIQLKSYTKKLYMVPKNWLREKVKHSLKRNFQELLENLKNYGNLLSL